MRLINGQVYDEATYQSAVALSRGNATLREKMRSTLYGLNLTEDQIETALTPLVNLHAGLDREIASYEEVRRQLAGVPLEDLGEVVPRLRELHRLTQYGFAQQSGIGATTVKNREAESYRKTPFGELVSALATLGYTATVTLKHTNGKDG